MNFGFNSNVRVGDAVYHIQTEDRGPSHPYLDTVVYEAGRVIYKRSTSYEDFAAAASKDHDLAQQLHDRLAQQHREVIAQVEAGTLSLRGKSEQASEGAHAVTNDGLEVRLTNPKTWFASGNVTLQIDLRRRTSQQAVGDAEVEAFIECQKERTHCAVVQTDAAGTAILKFQMPPTAADGASLVIRATDGTLYGELRFRLKAKLLGTAPAPASK